MSAEASSLAPGEGAVWVRAGDVVTASYYGPSGTAPAGSHRVSVVEASPVPAMEWYALGVLAALLAAAPLVKAAITRVGRA